MSVGWRGNAQGVRPRRRPNKPTRRGTFVSGLADLVAYRSVVVIRRDRSCQGLRIRRSAATATAAPGTDLLRKVAGESGVNALGQIPQVRQLVSADVLVERRQRLRVDGSALNQGGSDDGLRLDLPIGHGGPPRT